MFIEFLEQVYILFFGRAGRGEHGMFEGLLKGALISQNGINNVRDTEGRFNDV